MGERDPWASTDHFALARRAAGIEQPSMWCVYVIRLNPDEQGNQKYYVGSTSSLMSRIHNHAMGNERSSAWVKRWGYDSLVETRYCVNRESALTTEVALTVEWKVKMGWRHVRGAQDCRSDDGTNGQPAYWEAPERGTQRERSRSRDQQEAGE